MWQYIPAALGVLNTLYQTSSASKQNKNQLAWSRYNAQMQYNTAMGNIATQTKLAGFNFGLAKMAAEAQMGVAKYQYGLAQQAAEFEKSKVLYNRAVIQQSMLFNNSLLDAEIADMWEAADLDIELLANQREVERGTIAVQNFSGVVKEGDSFADVMTDSLTQQYLDQTVIKHNATRQVEAIQREQASNLFEGRQAMARVAWEGAINRYNILLGAQANYANAALGAQSTLLQGAANYAGAMMQASADRRTAAYQYQAGMYGADFQYSSNQQQIKNNFVSGIFGSIGQGVSTYYMLKQPPTSNYMSTLFTSTASGGTKPVSSYSTSSQYPTTPYRFATGYTANISLADPGTSTMVGI